tara:strand:+ start:372 stop:530 length:159 start_codon:yes stop_codon:yes gene_type:complete
MNIKKLTYNDIDKKLNHLINKVKRLSEIKNRKVKIVDTVSMVKKKKVEKVLV